MISIVIVLRLRNMVFHSIVRYCVSFWVPFIVQTSWTEMQEENECKINQSTNRYLDTQILINGQSPAHFILVMLAKHLSKELSVIIRTLVRLWLCVQTQNVLDLEWTFSFIETLKLNELFNLLLIEIRGASLSFFIWLACIKHLSIWRDDTEWMNRSDFSCVAFKIQKTAVQSCVSAKSLCKT